MVLLWHLAAVCLRNAAFFKDDSLGPERRNVGGRYRTRALPALTSPTRIHAEKATDLVREASLYKPLTISLNTIMVYCGSFNHKIRFQNQRSGLQEVHLLPTFFFAFTSSTFEK